MDLSKIISISGRRGLFKTISQTKNSVIVESLEDAKRFPVFPNEKISSLEEISLYTIGEELPLKSVLKNLYGKLEGEEAPDPKSDEGQVRSFFLEVIPDYDQERVYFSDIRKILSWYNQLLEKGLLDFSEPEEPAAEEASVSEPESGQTTEPEKTGEKKPKRPGKPAKTKKKSAE